MTTIPDGEDVTEFFAHLDDTNETGGTWVAAVGTLATAELALSGAGGDESRVGFGAATLVSLLGPARGPLMAVLSLHEGGAVVAGRLSRGASASVTFTVLGAAPAPVPGQPKAPAVAPKKPEEDEEADDLPVQGDRIDHFVFGLCDVMVVQGERFKIREAGGGKLREIHVGPFRLSKPVVRDGKRVFKLVKRS